VTGRQRTKERRDCAPVVAPERREVIAALGELVDRQARRGGEVNAEPDQHADAGGAEAVMPAGAFAEAAADERRQKRTEIDADIEDRVGAVAPAVARRIEAADLGRDVGLERAVAENEGGEREKQQRLEYHHEMAERHQHGADDHRPALPEHAVGKKPAEQRRQIDEPGVKTVDLGGERLRAERAGQRFEHALDRGKADDSLGLPGLQQVFDEIKHEQSAHAVVGEPLPHFGREQKGEAARMAEKVGRKGPG
jgi:hypothetical protein